MLIEIVCSAWLSFVAGAHGTAAWRSWRARREPAHDTTSARPDDDQGDSTVALLVRPLAGAEPGLESRLGELGGVTSVRFAVSDVQDGAYEPARRVVAALRERGVSANLSVTGAEGPNHKVDQLARALADSDATWNVAVICDSDVQLANHDLHAALRIFRDPAVGVVWLAPVSPEGSSRGDRAIAAVLSGSLHAFPLLGHIDRTGVVGKALLVRREALVVVGGLASLRYHLGEDLELGRRVRAAGYRVELAREVVRTEARQVSFRAAVARFTRWMAVVRTQRPALLWSYPLLFGATTPALGFALALRTGWLLGPIALLLLTRTAVWSEARRIARLPRKPAALAFDLVLSDAVIWLAFVRSLRSGPLRWGERTLFVDGASRLQG